MEAAVRGQGPQWLGGGQHRAVDLAREAAADPGPRRSLTLLLQEMENREARLPVDERFDFGRLRRWLDLQTGGPGPVSG